MSNGKLKYAEISREIIGCAMKVHSALGSGFQEKIYQRALAIEFKNAHLSFGREVETEVEYADISIGTRRVDFLVEEVFSVEIKAVSELTDAHLCQAVNYLEAFHLEVGLLINFGGRKLEFRRLINNKWHT